MVNQVIKFLYVKNVNFNLMIRYCCRKTKDFYITYKIAHNHLVEVDLGGGGERFLTSNHSGNM